MRSDQKYTTVGALNSLASVLADEGNLTSATKLSEEARSIARSMASKPREASILLTLASLAVENGKAADAETLVRDALDRYLKEQNPTAQAGAYNALAQTCLAEMKIREARDAVEHALALRSPSVQTRLSLAITAARVQESTSPADAIAHLRSTVDEATKRGYLRLAFEARLRLSEIEIRAGQLEVGRAHLESLKSEAGKKGFALVARKAQAALEAQQREPR